MESKGLFWWARPDSNRRPLPCQGSGGQQIATPQTGNQQHAGNQFGPQLDLDQVTGPLLVHALRAVIEVGVAEIMAGRIDRSLGEKLRCLSREGRAREHARQFGEAVRG